MSGYITNINRCLVGYFLFVTPGSQTLCMFALPAHLHTVGPHLNTRHPSVASGHCTAHHSSDPLCKGLRSRKCYTGQGLCSRYTLSTVTTQFVLPLCPAWEQLRDSVAEPKSPKSQRLTGNAPFFTQLEWLLHISRCSVPEGKAHKWLACLCRGDRGPEGAETHESGQTGTNPP